MASRRSKSGRKQKKKKQSPKSAIGPSRATSGRGPTESTEVSALQLKPRPWPDEQPEDVAVFSKEARNALSEPSRSQAEAVGEALEQVAQGEFAEATARLKEIPRSSPLAEWRLFLRGLIAHYQADLESARQNWARLDPARRPARIAAALLRGEGHSPLETEASEPPRHLVQAVETLRVRGKLIAAAEQIANTRHRRPQQTFSPSQLSLLSDLLTRYQRIDPEFCTRFAQACVQVASCQPDPALFKLLIERVAGPAHDPSWNLYASEYLGSFRGGDIESEEFLDRYLSDLETLKLPEKQRDALASLVYFREAERECHQATQLPWGFMFRDLEEQFEEADRWLKLSLKSYPANRRAHLLRLKNLEDRCEQTKMTKSLRGKLLKAKAEFVEQFPEEIDSALWLIDQYFDDDELEKAESLIQQLEGRRVSDPRAKSLPWKLRLREAMRVARRKAHIPLAHHTLDAAESLWPNWLSRDWIPFLRAGLELRAGSRQSFEKLDREARSALGRADWVADFYTFWALQQMQVPSADLKPFRTKLDHHIQACAGYPLDEFLQLGSFFWDLTRVGLRHKGYRMQASKLGKILCRRLESAGLSNAPSPAYSDTCCWIASHKFWSSDPYRPQEPEWASDAADQSPQVAASVLEWLVNLHYVGRKIIEVRAWIEQVEKAAQSEKDVFYRHRFEEIARQAGQLLREWEGRFGRSGPAFESMFFDDDEDEDESDYPDDPDYLDDDEDDEDDEDVDFEGDSSYQSRPPWVIFGPSDPDEEEEEETELAGEFDYYELLAHAPPKVAKTLQKLGEGSTRLLWIVTSQLESLLELKGARSEEEVQAAADDILRVFVEPGVSLPDLTLVLGYFTWYMVAFPDQDGMGPEPDPVFGAHRTASASAAASAAAPVSAPDLSGQTSSEPQESSSDDPPPRGKLSAAERRRRQREKKRNRR
jgi:hypothetical protein